MLDVADFQMEDARRNNAHASALAQKAIPFDPAKLPERCVMEIKYDGIGLLDVDGAVQSLEGVPFDCARHLFHELASIRAAFGMPMVLHGEYVETGGFQAALSAFNSGDGSGAVVLWDAVPLSAWRGTSEGMALWQRRALLQSAMDVARPGMVSLAPQMPIEADAEIIRAAMYAAVDDHQEGIVVKDAWGAYRRGRSASWMKVKPGRTLDVPIQSLRLDDSGTVLKSVVVTIEGRPAIVAAGFSEALRRQLGEFQPGRMVEISYVGLTRGGALQGAAFKRFRDDKVIPNGR